MCPDCVLDVERQIRRLPKDVDELTELIAATGSSTDAKVAGSRDLQVPIRLSIEALRAEIDFELQFWAEVLGMETQASCRLEYRVAKAAGFLVPRVDTLLQLGPQERSAWTPDGEPLRDWWGNREVIERTGIEGALRLIELHHRVRRAAGRTRLVHRLTPACPWCDQRALVRHNGSDVVECEGCGKEIEERYYSWFVCYLVEQESAA